MAAWPVWDEFRNDALDNGRVVDKSDDRKVTTSEGLSYAMFFALVTNDQVAFRPASPAWTADDLSGGDLTKTLAPPGSGAGDAATSGAFSTPTTPPTPTCGSPGASSRQVVSGSPRSTRRRAWRCSSSSKKEVRAVDDLGSVVLPGRVGFEDNGTVKLNPSYYPLFLFKRFALEDAYWNEVYEGSLRMLLRSSPAGIAPDWALFDKGGRLVPAQRRRLRDRQLQRHPHVSVGGHDVARRSQPRDPHEALQPDGRGDEGAQHARPRRSTRSILPSTTRVPSASAPASSRCSETTAPRASCAAWSTPKGFRARATTRACSRSTAEAGMKAASRSTPTAA